MSVVTNPNLHIGMCLQAGSPLYLACPYLPSWRLKPSLSLLMPSWANLHHHRPQRHHASLPSPKCFDYACIMHLKLPMKFSMDVKSNGVAVFLMGTNIAIANQLLLTTRTIAYAGVLKLCGTSSCTSFFTLWIVTQHSSKATWCAWGPMCTQTLMRWAPVCTTYNIMTKHVWIHFGLILQWWQAIDTHSSSKVSTINGSAATPSQLVSFGRHGFKHHTSRMTNTLRIE